VSKACLKQCPRKPSRTLLLIGIISALPTAVFTALARAAASISTMLRLKLNLPGNSETSTSPIRVLPLARKPQAAIYLCLLAQFMTVFSVGGIQQHSVAFVEFGSIPQQYCSMPVNVTCSIGEKLTGYLVCHVFHPACKVMCFIIIII
jgi:hypothetical protein